MMIIPHLYIEYTRTSEIEPSVRQRKDVRTCRGALREMNIIVVTCLESQIAGALVERYQGHLAFEGEGER